MRSDRNVRPCVIHTRYSISSRMWFDNDRFHAVCFFWCARCWRRGSLVDHIVTWQAHYQKPQSLSLKFFQEGNERRTSSQLRKKDNLAKCDTCLFLLPYLKFLFYGIFPLYLIEINFHFSKSGSWLFVRAKSVWLSYW